MRRKMARVLILQFLVLGAAAVGTASASTIDFTGLPNNTVIANGYGNTPGVTVTWNAACSWDSGYGDLQFIAFAAASPCGASGAVGVATFTADPGFEVNLQSFDVGGYFSGVTYYGGGADHRIEILDETNAVVFDSLAFGIPQGGHTSFTPNLMSSVGGSLTLRFDVGAAANDKWYLGIDNINFGAQTVGITATPEPGSVILLGSGLVGLARKWRKRRA